MYEGVEHALHFPHLRLRDVTFIILFHIHVLDTIVFITADDTTALQCTSDMITAFCKTFILRLRPEELDVWFSIHAIVMSQQFTLYGIEYPQIPHFGWRLENPLAQPMQFTSAHVLISIIAVGDVVARLHSDIDHSEKIDRRIIIVPTFGAWMSNRRHQNYAQGE